MNFLSWGCLQTVKKLILAQLRFFLSFLFSFFLHNFCSWFYWYWSSKQFKMFLLFGKFLAKSYIFCVTHLNLHFKLLEYFDGKLSVENSSPAWKKENIAQNTQKLSFNSMKKLHKNTFQVLNLCEFTFIFLVSHNVGSSQPERVEIFETLVKKKNISNIRVIFILEL